MRSGYHKQDDMPIHLQELHDHGNFNTTVNTARTKAVDDGNSEDDILPIMTGINKRTEITITAV